MHFHLNLLHTFIIAHISDKTDITSLRNETGVKSMQPPYLHSITTLAHRHYANCVILMDISCKLTCDIIAPVEILKLTMTKCE